MDSLRSTEFAAETTYLNTASCGLGPARSTAAVREALDGWSRGDLSSFDPAVTASREAFARIAGVPAERVAIGSAVSAHVGLIASGLPEGAEVLVVEGDFSSLVNPFAVRKDLKLRAVPLERVAEEIRPGTALVAVSSVQSADGRVADLAAVRAAASAHGTRTLVDATQSLGWLPLDAGEFDYVVCGAFKWLMCPRGASFLVVGESAAAELTPVFAGWSAGEVPEMSSYGTIAELASSARRFDLSPAYLSYVGAAPSLALVEEIGVEAIGAHDLALAERFRTGLAELGHEPISTGGSPIVATAGLGHLAPALSREGIQLAARAGNLRAAFHLYNSAADVDHLLEAMASVLRN
ncbi:aminotransferase class V-fold PLP-dependent enzyme [Streptantibioticus parmotrematis]|uniref:aminotransferase class V-fold PLP-dependent enzyme n=1 Tax=Streptantibioticus parmotrematis TaxID=2873249 RepID=UPI0033FB1154